MRFTEMAERRQGCVVLLWSGFFALVGFLFGVIVTAVLTAWGGW